MRPCGGAAVELCEALRWYSTAARVAGQKQNMLARRACIAARPHGNLAAQNAAPDFAST
jgi:hypothetical protein